MRGVIENPIPGLQVLAEGGSDTLIGMWLLDSILQVFFTPRYM